MTAAEVRSTLGTTADTLHEAARLMRNRAQAVSPGPWGTTWDNQVVGAYGSPDDGVQLADCFDGDALAVHIASWHPTVALLVADWLDETAEAIGADLRGDVGQTYAPLAVARAFLGESA